MTVSLGLEKVIGVSRRGSGAPETLIEVPRRVSSALETVIDMSMSLSGGPEGAEPRHGTSNAHPSAQAPAIGAPRIGRRCAIERVCPEPAARAHVGLDAESASSLEASTMPSSRSPAGTRDTPAARHDE
jgi:hypothetical protein